LDLESDRVRDVFERALPQGRRSFRRDAQFLPF